MRRHDRLSWLGACHGILRRAEIRSADEYRAAPPSKLAQLHIYRPAIRGLVAAGHADVLLALWPPKTARGEQLHWSVAKITSMPTVRLLGVHRGNHGGVGEEILKLSYDLAETGAEREAWRTLLEALRE